MITDEMELFRCPDAPLISEEGMPFGQFKVRNLDVTIISSDPEWEHCTVSTNTRCPTWDEMCEIKQLIWGEDETVIQFHPAKIAYVNIHPYALHLWRNTAGHRLPDLRMVYSGRTKIRKSS